MQRDLHLVHADADRSKAIDLSIAVCDDEPAVRAQLIRIASDTLAFSEACVRFCEFSDGESLLRAYENGTADFQIVLLDIKMRDLNGISAAKALRNYDTNALIVFVTSSAEYVFRGYEVKAFRYVLKAELSHAFPKIIEECLEELCTTAQTFVFRAGAQDLSVRLADILYFESDRRQITVHTKQEDYTFYGKLDAVEKELKNNDFVRCHQSFLVNAKEIKTVTSDTLTLSCGASLPISKSRREAVRRASLWAMR